MNEGKRLVLARVPGDIEVRLVEQRAHRAAVVVEHPHLAGMLLHGLDGPDRVRFRGGEQLFEPPPDHVRARGTGWWRGRCRTGRSSRGAARASTDPLDVRGGGGRVLGGAQERDVRAVPARDVRYLLAVRGDQHPVEDAGRLRGRDRVREQRMAGERPDVLPGHPFRAGTRPDQCDRSRHRPPSASATRAASVGQGTPPRAAARSTEPAIASSSDGRPR